jgi:hypothetical protein
MVAWNIMGTSSVCFLRNCFQILCKIVSKTAIQQLTDEISVPLKLYDLVQMYGESKLLHFHNAY